MEDAVGLLQQADHALPLGRFRPRQSRVSGRFTEGRFQATRGGGEVADQLRKGIASGAVVPFAVVGLGQPEKVLIGIRGRLALVGGKQFDGAGVVR